MAVFDSRATQDQADDTLHQALVEAFEEYFTQAQEAILGPGAVTADATPGDPPSLGAWPGMGLWDVLVAETVAPAIEAVFGVAFDAAARSDVLQQNRYRTAYMEQVFDRLSSVVWPQDAFERIQGDLAEGVDAGESTAQLRERVAEALQVDRHSYMAERIARTESHTAVEGGTHSAMLAWQEESGEVMYQRWIATPGNRTRPEHLAASGQTVPIDEPFMVGGEALAFPGDPNGSAHNTIGCRCSTLVGTLEELDGLPSSDADISAAAHTNGGFVAENVSPDRVYWRGVLAPLEARGDSRILAEPEDGHVLTSDHMWLSFQRESNAGHDGKVSVGRIDRAWIADGMLWGFGEIDMKDETGVAQEVARKMRDGFMGTISIDPADIEDADIETRLYTVDDELVDVDSWDADDLYEAIEAGLIRERSYFSTWRLAGATLVQDPAFHTSRGEKSSAFIEIVDADAIVAAVVGNTELEFADLDHPWDEEEALQALQGTEQLGQGCFWRSDDAEPDSNDPADYLLAFATVLDGELRAVPRGVVAASDALQQGGDLPEQAQEILRDRVGAYYQRMAEEFDDDSIVPPWEQDQQESSMTASVGSSWAEQVASVVPASPPGHWFTNPQLTGLTKVRVTDEGRVYGHVADWNQPHIGMQGQPVYPPRCESGGAYPRFHRHPIRTSDGGRVNTGPLTSAGHASTGRGVTPAAAMAHYDDPRFVVANVVCGEDEFGIWVAGALRPGVEPWQVAFADTYSFSGDWRNGEMVAACAVSVEGFFVPNDDSVVALAASAGAPEPPSAQVRYRVEDGYTTALVAAGVVTPKRSSRAGIRQVLSTTTSGFEGLSDKLDSLTQQMGKIAYEQAMQALRDREKELQEKQEIEELARQISAPAVAAAKEMVEGSGRWLTF